MPSIRKLLVAGCSSPDILKLINAINTHSTNQYEIIGYLDVDETYIRDGYRGYRVWDEKAFILEEDTDYSICVNVASTMKRRQRVIENLKAKGFRDFPAFIDPTTDMWAVEFEEGIQISSGCNIGPYVSIGAFSILLMGVNVNHETVIGSCTFLGPSCTILGRASIEDFVYIGAGAVVFPNVTIGEWSIIGAGSVVREDVAPGEVVVGIPARRIGHNPDMKS